MMKGWQRTAEPQDLQLLIGDDSTSHPKLESSPRLKRKIRESVEVVLVSDSVEPAAGQPFTGDEFLAQGSVWIKNGVVRASRMTVWVRPGGQSIQRVSAIDPARSARAPSTRGSARWARWRWSPGGTP